MHRRDEPVGSRGRDEFDLIAAGSYHRNIAQKLIWFMAEHGYEPPSPWS
jgi:hypothetical protein